jgi:hypothetical protein
VSAAGRTAYAAWREAYELAGAEQTELAIRDRRNTVCDPDEGTRDMTSETSTNPAPGMNLDEALAVLRHLAADEREAQAYGVLAGALATLRVQRQDTLDLVKELEHKAWSDGGNHTVRAIVRAVREALGAVS